MKPVSYIVSLTIAFFALFQSVMAQSLEDLPKLYELKGKKLLEKKEPLQNKKGQWGYVDSEGKYIIRPIFSEACPFEGKRARICIDGKWGTIGDHGLYVLMPIYDKIEPYSSDSLAIARFRGAFCLINDNGRVVLKESYDSLSYSDYGYHSYKGDKVGTLSAKGEVILKPMFDAIKQMDSRRGVEQILKDGKWSVLRNGTHIHQNKWDKELHLLQSGAKVDLYLATMNGKFGVVTTFGDFVVPCVYDEISADLSGRYYVTMLNGRYGALSLKMVELVPPVLDSKPFIGEEVFPVHDSGNFYAANINGSVPFKDCSSLYQMFKPEEYLTTKSIPDWSKSVVIEEGLLRRQKEIDAARVLNSIFKQNSNKLSSFLSHSSLPEGFSPVVRNIDAEKYGIMPHGRFVQSKGTVADIQGKTVLYISQSQYDDDLSVLLSPQGERFVRVDGVEISLKNAVEKFGLENLGEISPMDYTFLSENKVMVRMTSSAGAQQYVDSEAKTQVMFFMDTDSRTVQKVSVMPVSEPQPLVASRFSGFYAYSLGTQELDSSNPLKRYDRNGVLDWTFVPNTGEKFYDIEETEDFIYLCGSIVGGRSQKPVVLQLDKRGKRVQELPVPYDGSCCKGLICKDYLMYVKLISGKSPGEDFYPLYLLEDLNDNFGVSPKCTWENWGGALLGGCGLVGLSGEWLEAPVLSSDQMSTAFEREYSSFSSDYLIVRHRGLYGAVDKNGQQVIDAKYDRLEHLKNPFYFRAVVDDAQGVVDAEGRIIVPLKYKYVGHMGDDMIIVNDGEKWGCYDKTGKQIVPLQYEEIEEYVDGKARFKYKKWSGMIDKKGEICLPPFADKLSDLSEGAAKVVIKNKSGFVTKNGDWICPPIYDDAGSYSGGMAYVSDNSMYGYVDLSGELVVPMTYTKAKDFNAHSGVACVEKNGKWGAIDLKGEEILPCKYDSAEATSDGYILVMREGKYGIFSKQSECICPTILDSVVITDDVLFKNGAAAARLSDQRVRVDIQGNIIHLYSLLAKN